MAEQEEKKKTSLGLEENLEGALAYALGFLTGILFFLLEKESKFVKFHAVQSTLTFLAIFVIDMVIGYIPYIGHILGWAFGIAVFVFWIFCMVKAYQGEYFKVPVIGNIAENQIQ
ncbi:MAG: DUF4870 domain-containing protein [Candidatus Asgardarchaeia archaeon]